MTTTDGFVEALAASSMFKITWDGLDLVEFTGKPVLLNVWWLLKDGLLVIEGLICVVEPWTCTEGPLIFIDGPCILIACGCTYNGKQQQHIIKKCSSNFQLNVNLT